MFFKRKLLSFINILVKVLFLTCRKDLKLNLRGIFQHFKTLSLTNTNTKHSSPLNIKVHKLKKKTFLLFGKRPFTSFSLPAVTFCHSTEPGCQLMIIRYILAKPVHKNKLFSHFISVYKTWHHVHEKPVFLKRFALYITLLYCIN